MSGDRLRRLEFINSNNISAMYKEHIKSSPTCHASVVTGNGVSY